MTKKLDLEKKLNDLQDIVEDHEEEILKLKHQVWTLKNDIVIDIPASKDSLFIHKSTIKEVLIELIKQLGLELEYKKTEELLKEKVIENK